MRAADMGDKLAVIKLALHGALGYIDELLAGNAGGRPRAQAEKEETPPPAFRWAPGESTRLALFPIRHDDIWAIRKTLEGSHWTAQEVDVTKDKQQWDKQMTAEEKHFIKFQLGFFSRADIDVLRNLDENFGEEIDCLEARMAYAAQKDQECVHTESYNIQIDTVLTGTERDEVLEAVRTMPAVAQMRAWTLRWFDRALPIGDRLAAWAAVEGVLFSSGFASLQWLRERNLLPGVTDFNTFVARDEGVHTLLSCLLVRVYLVVKPCQARVEAIFSEAVEAVDVLVNDSLPVGLIGINAGLMRQYVRFQADCVLIDMGFLPMYRVKNPFPFMDKLTLNEIAKTNFFERRPTQYQSPTKSGASRLAIDASPVEY